MFDQSFRVSQLELPASLSFENVIFVMEDVDAASPIVRSRDRAATRCKDKRRRAAARKARVGAFACSAQYQLYEKSSTLELESVLLYELVQS